MRISFIATSQKLPKNCYYRSQWSVKDFLQVSYGNNKKVRFFFINNDHIFDLVTSRINSYFNKIIKSNLLKYSRLWFSVTLISYKLSVYQCTYTKHIHWRCMARLEADIIFSFFNLFCVYSYISSQDGIIKNRTRLAGWTGNRSWFWFVTFFGSGQFDYSLTENIGIWRSH